MAIHALLDVHFLCGYPPLRRGLGRGYAMSQLEDGLDYSSDIHGDWGVAGAYGRECRWLSVGSHSLVGFYGDREAN